MLKVQMPLVCHFGIIKRKKYKGYCSIVHMVYICERCDYQTNVRAHFLKHVNRKYLCPPIKSDVPMSHMLPQLEKEVGSHECPFCHKRYASRSGLSYHIERCEEMQHQQTVASTPTSSVTANNSIGSLQAPTQIITGNNNTVKQEIHIHMHPFGKEKVDHISGEFRNECFEAGISGVLRMLDSIFFNDMTPENHNVKMKSIKRMLVEVFRNPHWEIKSFQEVANSMIYKSTCEIVKDVKVEDLKNENKFYEYHAVCTMPKENVKKAENHVKGKLMTRRMTDKS